MEKTTFWSVGGGGNVRGWRCRAYLYHGCRVTNESRKRARLRRTARGTGPARRLDSRCRVPSTRPRGRRRVVRDGWKTKAELPRRDQDRGYIARAGESPRWQYCWYLLLVHFAVSSLRGYVSHSFVWYPCPVGFTDYTSACWCRQWRI